MPVIQQVDRQGQSKQYYFPLVIPNDYAKWVVADFAKRFFSIVVSAYFCSMLAAVSAYAVGTVTHYAIEKIKVDFSDWEVNSQIAIKILSVVNKCFGSIKTPIYGIGVGRLLILSWVCTKSSYKWIYQRLTASNTDMLNRTIQLRDPNDRLNIGEKVFIYTFSLSFGFSVAYFIERVLHVISMGIISSNSYLYNHSILSDLLPSNDPIIPLISRIGRQILETGPIASFYIVGGVSGLFLGRWWTQDFQEVQQVYTRIQEAEAPIPRRGLRRRRT